MSSGRWHTAQFLKKIGATSLVKVTCLLAGLLSFAPMVGGVNRQNAAKTKIAAANRSLLIGFTSRLSVPTFRLRVYAITLWENLIFSLLTSLPFFNVVISPVMKGMGISKLGSLSLPEFPENS